MNHAAYDRKEGKSPITGANLCQGAALVADMDNSRRGGEPEMHVETPRANPEGVSVPRVGRHRSGVQTSR